MQLPCYQSKTQGFTLLELLIVISILGLVVTLVSPLAAERVDKANAKSEFLAFKGTLKLQSLRAFTRGVSTKIVLHNHYFKSVDSDGEVRSETFKYIQFPRQELVINTNGYPSVSSIAVSVHSVARTIEFHEIVGADKDAIYAE